MTRKGQHSPDYRPDIDRLTELLEQEIAAVMGGDLERVQELIEEKQALVARLEAAGPGMKERLNRNDWHANDLREALTRLRDLMQRDTRVIERVVSVLKDVASQMLGDGAGLGDLYDAKGNKKAPKSEAPKAFDVSL